ncbi:hypothetical protein [Leuconostoc citreum]|uniref:hypothetical protein n=1 Tax=Leuconostoc citreum TaxID=33964 RepID=UPI0032DEAB74
MTKQTMLIGGGIASGLVILILVILLMGTSKQQQATPTKLPRIDQAKVMKYLMKIRMLMVKKLVIIR